MTTNGQTLNGVVRKLRDGYGFIAGYDGTDYYFHWTAMQKASKNFREVIVGDRVTFQPYPGAEGKGPKAIEVLVVA